MCLGDSSGLDRCVDGPSFRGELGVLEVYEVEQVFVWWVDFGDESEVCDEFGGGYEAQVGGRVCGVGTNSWHVSEARKILKSIWHRGHAVLVVYMLFWWGLLCVL